MKSYYFFLAICLSVSMVGLAQTNTVTIDCQNQTLNPVEVEKDSKVKFVLSTNCPADIQIQYEIVGEAPKQVALGEEITVSQTLPVSVSGANGLSFTVDLKVKTPPPHKKVKHPKQPVADALMLDSLLQARDTGSIRQILEYWKITAADCVNINYLKDYAFVFPKSDASTQSSAQNQSTDTQAPAPSWFSTLFPPKAIIDVLAQLAVERFKQELTIAYLDGFRKKLDSLEELQTLLPGTFQTLKEEDFFNYSVAIPMLRENAFKDFEAFPVNMKSLVKSKKGQIQNNAYPILMSSCDLIRSVQIGQIASESIETIAEEDYITKDTTDFGKVVKVLAGFSRNLHSWDKQPTPTGWASKEDINLLLARPDAFNFWMGIMMKNERTKSFAVKIKFDGGVEKSIFDLLNKDTFKVNKKGRLLLFHFNRVTTTAEQLKLADKPDSLRNAKVGELAIAICDLIAEVGDVFKVEQQTLKNYTQVLRSAAQLEHAFRTKQFGVVLSQLLQLVEVSFGSEGKDWQDALRKYGKLLVALIEAKNTESVKAALSAAAEPVQSYRLKRQKNSFGISIGMYPGGSFGREWTLDDSDKKSESGRLVAPTVPVGLGADFGTRCGSFSLFFPIIDIGAVAAFRFQDNVSVLPDLAWSNVVAPGAYFMYGIPRSPISLGLGWQIGPALRKVTTDAGTLKERNYRFALNIGVDVPLFQKTKKW